jgi:hypothetical protein
MVERCGYAFYGLFALKLVAVVPEELISPRLREYEVSELDWVLSFIVPCKIRCKKCGPDFFVLHLPTKIWRIRFLGSNSAHTYRHDIIHYKLTKFYTGFRLIVVSLDKNVCARVDDRLNIFRAFSPAALPHPGGQRRIDYRILRYLHKSIPYRLLKSDYNKYSLSIDSSFAS